MMEEQQRLEWLYRGSKILEIQMREWNIVEKDVTTKRSGLSGY